MTTLKLKYPLKTWVCTDPDVQQYGRQLTDTLFEFKDKTTNATLIDLNDYEHKEKESCINSYGYTQMTGENKVTGLHNIVELYGRQANWIMAECIFESEQ